MNTNLEEYLDNLKSQMRKGTLEFCVLLVISQGKAYTFDIIHKLKQADMVVVEGTLYPLLSRLKREGFLEYSWKESTSGPPRKYFSLTEKGKTAMEELKKYWKTFIKSVTNLK